MARDILRLEDEQCDEGINIEVERMQDDDFTFFMLSVQDAEYTAAIALTTEQMQQIAAFTK